jgi:hypothetical protein
MKKHANIGQRYELQGLGKPIATNYPLPIFYDTGSQPSEQLSVLAEYNRIGRR